MKQIFQNLKSGQTEMAEIPCPLPKPGHLFIRTHSSLISAGTERMLLEFGKANLLDKARNQPDKVRQVWDKIKTDGLLPTLESVRAKLDQPLRLGYCNIGSVEDSAPQPSFQPGFQPNFQASFQAGFQGSIPLFKQGDRVVSNGPHAEMVCVPQNLCAKIPDQVSDDEAAFTVLGAIGLQGIRLLQPTLGECFVVTGLGLIGLMAVQILQANGCHVLGIDPDPAKCDIASQFGVETVALSREDVPLSAALAFSKGRGVDGVLITAATKSSEPVHQAARMCRKRGRIVLVGVTGLELNRTDFYEKELSFQVSCSYGPGRYDPEYEEKGHDYPIGFVRWTEQRNFEAILELMAIGKLKVKPLISHRFRIEEAAKAYELIAGGKEPYLGIILTYDRGYDSGYDRGYDSGATDSRMAESRESAKERTVRLKEPVSPLVPAHSSPSSGLAAVGLIGAGNFTGQVLLPAIKKAGVKLKTIASTSGVSGTHLGKKYGFEQSTTDIERIIGDPAINTVFITTRHNTHACLALQAMRAGKHVFVEKPLCLTLEELDEITTLYHSSPSPVIGNLSPSSSPYPPISSLLPISPLLMVGFNRRFAPHIVKMKKLLDTVKIPKSFIMVVNAGFISQGHWTQDLNIGGGRIIGEACHFIDLLRFLAGSNIADSKITKMNDETKDTVTITISFTDGSIGTIHYFANGTKSFPKERLEVFCGEKILQLDNYKVLRGYGWKGFKDMRLWRQDKGHATEVADFIEAVKKGGPSPIPVEEIFEVFRTTIELATPVR